MINIVYSIVALVGGILLSKSLFDKHNLVVLKSFIKILSSVRLLVGVLLIALACFDLYKAKTTILFDTFCILAGVLLSLDYMVDTNKRINENEETSKQVQGIKQKRKPTDIVLGILMVGFAIAEIIKLF